MFVFVLDSNKTPLNPTHPARARKLLKSGKAAVFKKYPFTIIVQEEIEPTNQDLQLKIDPGAKTTGIALLAGNRVIWRANLNHRGFQIRESLTFRRQLRRSRRNRHTRYRQSRFNNRKRSDKWLAPSLMSRIHNILTWIKRLQKVANVSGISQELVRFDLQKMQNPEISGVQYQQGELQGYEMREYLLQKWQRKCAYCSTTNCQLEVEHIIPKSKGGSNRVSNLTLACRKCNEKKGNKPIEQFLKNKPDLLKIVLNQAKRPLADAAAVNSTRWKLFASLKGIGLPIETGSGGLTKYNRCRQKLPKDHSIDAACVGKSTPDNLIIVSQKVLQISAKGHGTRQLCRTDKHGFPSRYVPTCKTVKGFKTGDIVKAVVTNGKKIGTYVGRVALRSSGSFNISTVNGLVQGISHKYCSIVHRKDGYQYVS